jgi:branched-chain amino acid transport system substrate-binding protein
LVVAHVGPFTGPLAVNGLANHEGAKACVEEANVAGGVRGQTLRLVREDDEYKPESTVRLVRLVAQRDKPVAFLNLLGSANVGALLKDNTFEEIRIPAVGVTPGADVLRRPGSAWMFHVHASDSAQIKRILGHLSTIGLRRVAVAYQDIPFGHGGMKIVDENAPAAKLEVVGRVPVPSATEDFKAVVAELRKSNAQAYVMILVPNSGAAFVAHMRTAGDATPIYGMSYVPVKAIVQKAGANASLGIGLAQVTPNTFSTTTALVRQMNAAMGKYATAGTEPSQLHLIGYLSCRVLLEGLRLAGPGATPEKLKAALQRVRTDLGGYHVDFAGANEGSRFVDIGVVTRDGRLLY